MKQYMAVTADKYELPVIITDTAKELAEIYNMTQGTMYSYICRGIARKKERDKVKFIRVEV